MIHLKLKDWEESFVCAAFTADADTPSDEKRCKENRKEIKMIEDDLES